MDNNFTPISDACSKPGKYNVLGVVVDCLPITWSKGSSALVTFTIKDSDLDGNPWTGLKIKYFNDDSSTLPNVENNAVVLVRGIRTRMYQGNMTAVVSQRDQVPWAVFRPQSAPSSSPTISSGPAPFEPSLWERNKAQSLLDLVSGGDSGVQQNASRKKPSPGRTTVVQASKAPKTGGLPTLFVKDLAVNRLCQLLGQVIRLKSYDSEKCTMFLTDYTEHEELLDYKKPGDDDNGTEGDPYNYIKRNDSDDWPGPWGKRVLQVTLWEPHASFAREKLNPGDNVLLTYVQPKDNRYLEAAVHEDRRYPDKIHLRVCSNNDERVQELLKRRAEYWNVHGEPKKETKKANKQAKKVQGQKKEVRKEEGQLTLSTSTRIKKNANVKTRNYTTAISPLEKIILAESHKNNGPGGVVYQLPFQNVHYRSTVRVVDFFPPNLEDFAVQTEYTPLYTSQDSATGPTVGWQWRFCLLVEGIGPKQPNHEHRELVKLYVSGQDGDCLLNEEAADLRAQRRRLDRVREKLFLLWGNLEEQKKNALAAGKQTWGPVSSVPFECCIKEYGVPCAHMRDSNAMDIDGESCIQSDCFGWERRFAIFGTTIHEE
ncbi:unnamed protein product [Penicillium salamii]|nr:unnamed protein product [Penicillium salamii]